MGLLFVWSVPLVAAGFAHWDGAYQGRAGFSLLALLVVWGLLHAGTLWLNAALDRDESDVLWGEAVAPPPATRALGVTALVAAVAISVPLGPVVALFAACCAVLAALYSLPSTAWKGHPLGGPAVNVLGYGLLSALAGWWVTGLPTSPRALGVLAVVLLWVGGCYYLAQAFQADEDRARGYRTLVATHGGPAARDVGVGLLRLGSALLVLLVLAGWLPRLLLLAAPLWWWVERAVDSDALTSAWASRVFVRLFAVALVLVGLVGAQQALSLQVGGPTAGLDTARGWPVERLDTRNRRLEHLG